MRSNFLLCLDMYMVNLHLEKATLPHFESLHQETGHVLKPLFFQIPFGSQLFYRCKKWAFPLLNEKR